MSGSCPQAEPFGPAARFAVYYAPPAANEWWRAGCRWLQRDPESGAALTAPAVPGLTSGLAELTSEPRRYGWHATLVAPFRAAPGVTPAQIHAAALEWAARQHSVSVPVQVAQLERFVAVLPAGAGAAHQDDSRAALGALAADAVRTFAALRAAPNAAELDKRRTMRLSARQEALMQAWGYPFVFEEFRFHMTLSNNIGPADAHAMQAWWQPRLPALGALPIDGAALFVQAAPAADFILWQRLPFARAVSQ
jgi:Protein of unknown function (DUF1045)